MPPKLNAAQQRTEKAQEMQAKLAAQQAEQKSKREAAAKLISDAKESEEAERRERENPAQAVEVVELDPSLLAEINKIVDDAAHLKWVGDTQKPRQVISAPTAGSLPAVESSVDEALIGSLEMVVDDKGMIVTADSYDEDSEPLDAATSARTGPVDLQPPSPASLAKSRTPDNLIDKDRRWIVDAANLGRETSTDYPTRVATFLNQLSLYRKRISGLKINGIRFNEALGDLVAGAIWEDTGIMRHGKFPFLVDLDMSYAAVIGKHIPVMGLILNPIKSGYCPIKRLVLTQCRLGIQGTRTVFNSLQNNVFVEELVVNGNMCTDAVVPDIVRCLVSSSNRLRSLGLGSNGLTAASMTAFAAALEGNTLLRELQLNGNTIGDEGADSVFKAIRDNATLESLNLSYCGIKECPWAGRLRIMTGLGYLNLSQNEISDAGCSALCDALEKCVCLRHLDLSNNLFGDRLSVKLGNVIETNKGLQSLNLSSNNMIYECWNAIAVGLATNDTLIRLDLQMCDLDIKTAERLYQVLSVNNMVNLVMDMNPIPFILRTNARSYRRKGLPEAIPADPDAGGECLKRGHDWRAGRVQELLTAKQSLVIMDELKETALQQADDKAERLATQYAQDRQKRIKDGTDTSTSGAGAGEDEGNEGDAVSATGNGAASVASAAVGEGAGSAAGDGDGDVVDVVGAPAPVSRRIKVSKKAEQAAAAKLIADDASVTSSMLISLGAKQTKLNRATKAALDAGAEIDNMGHLILTVCYGRESEVLGTIEVTHHTTYPMTMEPIRPLVKQYLAGLGQLEMVHTLTENFVVLDANGLAVTGPQSTVRTVWSEASLNHHLLIVRPANWINLPEPNYPANSSEGASTSSASIVNIVTEIAALETEKDVRNAATRAALAMDISAEAAAELVDHLHTPSKKHDPNFAAEPFVSFEYDDDAFGVNAENDDMSMMSYDSGYSLGGGGDGEYRRNSDVDDQKNKVKWI